MNRTRDGESIPISGNRSCVSHRTLGEGSLGNRYKEKAARLFRNRRTAFLSGLVTGLMNHVADDVPTASEQNGGAADP